MSGVGDRPVRSPSSRGVTLAARRFNTPRFAGRLAAWTAVLVLSAAAWMVSSSAPGGRRFLARYFDLDVSAGKTQRFEHTPFGNIFGNDLNVGIYYSILIVKY